LLHFELQLLWFGSNSLNLEFFKVYLFLVFLDFQIIRVKLISPPFLAIWKQGSVLKWPAPWVSQGNGLKHWLV
jgi:hypothetical protein